MGLGLLAFLPGLMLMVFRTGGMIFTFPIFGRHGDSRFGRLTICVAMGALLYLPNPVILRLPESFVVFAVAAAREVLVGMLLGMGLNTIFSTLRFAGEIIGYDMGLNMSRAIDPNTGESGVVMSTLLEVLAILLFFRINGHHMVFRLLSKVNRILPLGKAFDVHAAASGLTSLGSVLLTNAMLIAAPVFAMMLMLTIVMLILSRAVPQINLMEFGFALRIIIALLGCVIFIPRAIPGIERMMEEIIAAVVKLVVPV